MSFQDHVKRYYGSTTVGERGQIVLPAKLRRRFGIKPGDKFLVLAGERMGGWGVVLIKADIVSKLLSSVFGKDLSKVLEELEGKKSSPAGRVRLSQK